MIIGSPKAYSESQEVGIELILYDRDLKFFLKDNQTGLERERMVCPRSLRELVVEPGD